MTPLELFAVLVAFVVLSPVLSVVGYGLLIGSLHALVRLCDVLERVRRAVR